MCKNKECKRKAKEREKIQKGICSKHNKKKEQFLVRLEQRKSRLVLHDHFVKRSFERVINDSQALTVLKEGDVIESSKHGENVRMLIFSYVKIKKGLYRPIHIIVEVIDKNNWMIVTGYCPESQCWKWNKTLDKRVCFCKNKKGRKNHD